MNHIAKYLTSFEATVLGLILFLSYRLFELQSLFFTFLPMPEKGIRLIASILVAFVIVFSLLLFSSHIHRFKLTKYDSGNWIKYSLFIFTLIINAYFWELFSPTDASQVLVTFFKATIIIYMAIFDYAYNHLFISLWFEKEEKERANISVSNLTAKESYLKQVIGKHQDDLKQLIIKQDPKVCPRCGKEFAILQQRNAHLRTCKSKA